ncbi:hypothetical protein [Shewanella waksmanii]|uniref:hypothetical protein n=1 Tax=Shewanella waksmanii TaxID=213783 RepID=UPI00048DF91D|nr:hypothetical protein [Shewanella waksmanii]
MTNSIMVFLKITGLALVFSAANASPEHVATLDENIDVEASSFIHKQLEDKFSLNSPKDDGPVILHCKPWPECELHQPQTSFTY